MADSVRNLIVLSDGTGNSAARQSKTNVWRLYQAIELKDGRNQLAVFGDGVGTSGVRILRVLGLALGVGVKRNVLNLYKFLCRNYNPGDHTDDRIWAFGFSRGAFTIRVLLGLIKREGLVSFESEAELNRKARAAYRAYRKKSFPAYGREKAPPLPLVAAGRVLRDLLISAWNAMMRRYPDNIPRKPINVHFVGLWDTVAAYGLPIDELTTAVDKWIWPMKFRGDVLKLLPNVDHARHALSLDDERTTFHPTPWDETAERNLVAKEEVKPGRLQQVWFAGTHADVGGGYPDDGLSYVPLLWMIHEAADKGLRFERPVVELYDALATPTGRIYDSRSGFGALYRYQPRDAHLLLNPPGVNLPRDAQLPLDKEDIMPLVHGSVMVRMGCGNDGYAPISLPAKIKVLPSPFGPPVHFDCEAVKQALEQAKPLRDAFEQQRHVLEDTQRLVDATSELAKRTELFELVQDTVWWRRVAYFVSLAFVVIAVAYPLLAQYFRIEVVTDPPNKIFGGLVGWARDLIKDFLPGFAERWLTAVVQNPAGAVLIIVGLGASLVFSRFLQLRICDRARAAWNVRSQVGGIRLDRLRQTGQRHALPNPRWLLPLARKARKNKWAVAAYRFLAQTLAPAGVLALSGILAVSLAHRAVFDLGSAFGTFCTRTLGDGNEEILVPSKKFETKLMCNATGVRLIEGRKYRIRLDMDEGVNGEWFDNGKRADVAGFTADSMRHYIASPLKRWWWENWFQPIARIGKVGNYEHVLQPAAPLPVAHFKDCPTEEKRPWWDIKGIPEAIKGTRSIACEAPKDKNRVLISDITADATGELFLYVNDAVLTLPRLTDVFYKQHSGTAKVTITRILAPGIEPATTPANGQ